MVLSKKAILIISLSTVGAVFAVVIIVVIVLLGGKSKTTVIPPINSSSISSHSSHSGSSTSSGSISSSSSSGSSTSSGSISSSSGSASSSGSSSSSGIVPDPRLPTNFSLWYFDANFPGTNQNFARMAGGVYIGNRRLYVISTSGVPTSAEYKWSFALVGVLSSTVIRYRISNLGTTTLFCSMDSDITNMYCSTQILNTSNQEFDVELVGNGFWGGSTSTVYVKTVGTSPVLYMWCDVLQSNFVLFTTFQSSNPTRHQFSLTSA